MDNQFYFELSNYIFSLGIQQKIDANKFCNYLDLLNENNIYFNKICEEIYKNIFNLNINYIKIYKNKYNCDELILFTNLYDNYRNLNYNENIKYAIFLHNHNNKLSNKIYYQIIDEHIKKSNLQIGPEYFYKKMENYAKKYYQSIDKNKVIDYKKWLYENHKFLYYNILYLLTRERYNYPIKDFIKFIYSNIK